MQLKEDDIKTIHHLGGSILGVSNDEIDAKLIVQTLK
jgi:hypothetical protein